MKKIIYVKGALLQVTFVATMLLITSCNYNQKTQDNKGVAEEQNDRNNNNNRGVGEDQNDQNNNNTRIVGENQNDRNNNNTGDVAGDQNYQRTEDSKELAEDQNDEKFNDNKQEKDAQFLVNAAEINLEEIQLGKLAQQNGTTAHVKELGKMMVDMHTKSQKDLTALAKSKAITIPTTLTENAQDSYTKLNKKSGSDFDKEYADLMVSRHKDAIDIYEKVSKNGNDSDIKNWATSALTDLRKNLDNSLVCQKKCDQDENRAMSK